MLSQHPERGPAWRTTTKLVLSMTVMMLQYQITSQMDTVLAEPLQR
jgi:hypothetical protein